MSPQFRPRKHRDINRGRIASLKAKAKGGSALQASLAEIGASFDQAALTNGLKLRVEDMIERGPCDDTVRARYGRRASMVVGYTLDQAIAKATQMLQDERERFEAASILGRPVRAPLELLRELRLILRMVRLDRHRTGFDQFPGLLSFLNPRPEQNVA